MNLYGKAVCQVLLLHILLAAVQSQQCPERCECVAESIVCTGLTAVPTFESNDGINFLVLSRNGITAVPAGAFEKLRNLAVIQFLDNPLTSIDGDAFRGLSKLHTLTISSTVAPNQQISLEKILQSTHLPELQTLQMKKFRIGSIIGPFDQSKLKEMRLEGCQISQINRDAFKTVPLEKLELNDNLLLNTFDWLTPLEKLTHLDLTRNKLAGELSQLPSLPKLNKLILEYNNIVELPFVAFTHVRTTLQNLVVRNNPMLTDADGISTLQVLQSVDLSFTAINNIPQNLEGASLKTLTIENTPLSHIAPGQLPKQLETLSLINCQKLLQINERTFEKTSRLKTLNLDELKFKTIESSSDWKKVLRSSYLPNLQSLGMVGTEEDPLTDSIWEALKPFSSLQLLDLSSNALTMIPDFFFQSFSQLKRLHLQRNKIASLNSASFYGLSNLNISIAFNRLTEINKCSLNLDSTDIDLEGNSLNCECKSRWLRVLLETKSQRTAQLDKLKCGSVTWRDKTPDSFCTAAEEAQLPPCSTMAPPTEPPEPAIYNIGIQIANKPNLEDGSTRVQMVINASAYENIITSWVVYYGKDCSSKTYNTGNPVNRNLPIDISKHLTPETEYCFCPTLYREFGMTPYEHTSYCRTITTETGGGGVNTAAIAGAVAGVAILLAVIIIVAVCCYCRHRRPAGKPGDKPNVDEDPYAYAEPEIAMGKRSAGTSKEQLNMRPRTRPNSRAFTRAKSTEGQLNQSQSSLAPRAPMQYRSTPVLQKAGVQNGHANRAFANSASSLHQTSAGSVPSGRLSAHSTAGYPMQSQSQPQPQPQHQQPSFNSRQQMPPAQARAVSQQPAHSAYLSRSTDQLAIRSSNRALPPPPRMANSAEVMLDPRRIDPNQYDYAVDGQGTYLDMSANNLDQESSTDYPPRYQPYNNNPQPPRPPRSRMGSASVASMASNERDSYPEQEGDTYVPMSIVPGSPGDRNSQAQLIHNEYGVPQSPGGQAQPQPQGMGRGQPPAAGQDNRGGPYYDIGRY